MKKGDEGGRRGMRGDEGGRRGSATSLTHYNIRTPSRNEHHIDTPDPKPPLALSVPPYLHPPPKHSIPPLYNIR